MGLLALDFVVQVDEDFDVIEGHQDIVLIVLDENFPELVIRFEVVKRVVNKEVVVELVNFQLVVVESEHIVLVAS